jgi:uncharacterized protein
VSQPWREAPPGLIIAVRVTPRASKSVLLPGTAGHFAARIAAPPVEGTANAALIEMIAEAFGVAKRDVALTAGETARVKRLTIAGDPKTLAGIAAALYGAGHER